MAATIDERVVEMRFDNKQFEANAKESIGTLEKLKQALGFREQSVGFDKIQKSIDRVDVSGLNGVIDGVKLKFSALEVAAITALTNITNRAVDAGIRLVKSLSVDQIGAGYGEYELKMGSIQTIISSTGESLETVNQYLEELNKYSDKTIYSFSDMTQNIGKFTNAGVKLEDSVKAIQGISNAAAVAGANSNEASRAMYNFAQAISSGSVKLIDWKSIELANMGTVEFKNQLIDTAVALGTVVKEGDKYRSTTTDLTGKVSDLFDATTMFTDSLSHQWMTTDVLVQTLSNYSTDVRNMSAAEKEAYEEKLRGIGYTEEQIKAIEELGIKAFNSAQDVKTFTQLTDTMRESVGSGWAQTYELIFGDFEESKKLWTNVNKTLGSIIEVSSNSRNELLKQWKKSGGRDALLDGIANTFDALLSIVRAIGTAFRKVFPKTTSSQLVDITNKFRDFTAKLKPSYQVLINLRRTFTGLFSILDIVGQAIGAFFKLIGPGISKIIDLSGGILMVTASIGGWITSLNRAIKENGWFIKAVEKIANVVENVVKKVQGTINGLGGVTEKIHVRMAPFTNVLEFMLNVVKSSGPIIITIIDGIGQAITFLMRSMSKALSYGGFNGWVDLLNVGFLIGIWKQLTSFIKNINKTVDHAGGFIKNIKGIFSGITTTFKELQNTLKAETLKKLAASIVMIAASMVVLSLIDSNKLTKVLGAVSVLILELTGVSKALEVTGSKKIFNGTGTSILKLSASVLIIAAAMKKISDIDSGKLLASLGVITALLIEMTGVSIVLSKFGGKVKTGVVGLLAFSTSIYILTYSIEKIGQLDTEVLKKGIISVGALLTELAAFMFAAKFGKIKPSQSIGIVALAASLLVLHKAIEVFGNMDSDKLFIGIKTVGVILAELAGFSLVAGNSKHITSTAISMIIMAKALEMLEKPMIVFGNMELKQIGRGLLVIGSTLAEVSLAMRLMPKNALTIGIGIVAVAEALTIISHIVLKSTAMSWERIGKGMVVLGGSMTVLAIAMNAMKGTLGASVAMLLMSSALAIFVPVLKKLSSLSLEDLVKGLTALATGFTVVGAAAFLLKPIIPSIIGLAGAMAMLGVASAAVGVGVFALSVALTTLAASGVVGAAALVEVIKILTIGVLETIERSASSLGSAVKTIILMLCDVVVECVPKIIETVLVVIKEVLTALADNAPEIVSKLLRLIVGVIDALAEDLPTIIQSVVNLFMQFFSGIVQALNNVNVDVLIEGIVVLGLISGIMLALGAMASLAPSAMIGVLSMGGVIAELSILLAAIGALSQIPGLNWLIGEGGDLLQGIGSAIGKFIGGIVGGIIGGVSAQLPQIGIDLSNFMLNLQSFIEGSKNIDEGVLASVGFLTAIILALAASDVLLGIGNLLGMRLEDVGIELSNFMSSMIPFITLSRTVKKESMEACQAMAKMILALTGADVIAGIGRIFGLTGNLSDFGEELEAFGPKIAKFSEDVRDINPEAVQGAAAAAEIIANLANKLPATDGLVQKIFGEKKSLSDFGTELETFAPSIVKFANDVKDVKKESVEGAHIAAEMMAGLYDKLPATDGLVQKIFGEKKSLSDFGTELETFGPKIKRFSLDIAGINPSSATGAATITDIMSTIANDLPNTDTLWQSIFGGGQVTLSEFGAELVKFGESMADFSSKLVNVNVGKLSNVVDSFTALVDLARDTGDVSANNLVNFSNKFSEISADSVNNFVITFEDGEIKAQTALTSFFAVITNSISDAAVTIDIFATEAGNGLCTALSVSIGNNKSLVTSAVNSLCNFLIKMLSESLRTIEIDKAGQEVPNRIAIGIASRHLTVVSSVEEIANSVIQTLKSAFGGPAFREIGESIGNDLSTGIESKIDKVRRSAERIANAAIDAAKAVLDEHSPSTVFIGIGDYATTALAIGLLKNVKMVSEASESVAEDAIAPVKNVMNGIKSLIDSGEFDNIQPVITPVVDLSNVKKGVGEIGSMMAQRFDISSTYRNAMETSATFNRQKDSERTMEEKSKAETQNTYEFNQYNYSPKALSRSEIYRQTNNQFSNFRKAVNPH